MAPRNGTTRNEDQEKEILEVGHEPVCHFVLVLYLQWIGCVLGEALPDEDFSILLKDGILLCRLINKIQPGSVKRVKDKVRRLPC